MPAAVVLVFTVAVAILFHGRTTRNLRLGVFRHPT
jgi:hypothetical protein